MERAILHSDLNCFYASVETLLHPEYAGRAIAVCGSTEERHGIVLAKSEAAKRAGVKTGMANHDALAVCPELIIVSPHYGSYLEFSRLVRDIYSKYTDMIEPFGIDECWLDITASQRLFGTPESVANTLREEVRSTLGLTLSVGVSFCKSFAKLGSDMKKPDATTVITRDNFREKIWGLPASELLFVGRATYKKLLSCGIVTIGNMAALGKETMVSMFGVRGAFLWEYANGHDNAPVMHRDFEFPVKSVGHGITCVSDLTGNEEVERVILELCQDIRHRLRQHSLAARGVALFIKDNKLGVKIQQKKLARPTGSALEIARAAYSLFLSAYSWQRPIRALTVSAIDLVPADSVFQLDLFTDIRSLKREKALENTVDDINTRYGENTVRPLSVVGMEKLPGSTVHETTLPGNMVY